ncbi:MAG: M13 family metallopeptidase [Thermoplasmata archaeon]
MDRSVPPETDFYRFAVGSWIRRNPIPADKVYWGAFSELSEYNYKRLRGLLERAAGRKRTARYSVEREVGDFYRAAVDAHRRNRLRFRPIARELAQIDKVCSMEGLVQVVAEFHNQGVPLLFETRVYPDKKNSGIYAFYLQQAGLSLPDRDYYLTPGFARQRRAFRRHLVRMLSLLGAPAAEARRDAGVILRIEAELAKASRSRVELRDEEKNYHKFRLPRLRALAPTISWDHYLSKRGATRLSYVIVGQPEFFEAVGQLLGRRPLAAWKAYLRWHLLRARAGYLHRPVAREYFDFFHRTLLGQSRPEPPWRRAARATDLAIGDALGKMFVNEYFPPAAAARMRRLVTDLRAVFRNRLRSLAWMTPATRRRALAKFEGFRVKIGHPKHFRDDSKLRIDRRDYVGNLRRSLEYEIRRKVSKLGRRVDPDEWRMTAPQVNAYFDPTQNEIVFPAGILQPPFFDATMDDAVNYGGIGLVIGHEITHGYDDQGRRYDANGNLREWWTPKDAREFGRRAKKVIAEYDRFEPLPGLHVKGALTVGENIADLGGASIAFEALQCRLARNPADRRPIEGLTPEQRFFISYGQIWRESIKEQTARMLLTVDEHSPGRFRVIGAVQNLPSFFEAFDIRPGTPMWQPKAGRVQIW